MPLAMASFSRRTPDDQRPNRLAAARARLGEPAFDLTESNPTRCSLPYPEDLLEALADPRGLAYRPEPKGPLAARAAVARQYLGWGVELDPERVVLTASTSEAYGFLMRLLADPGDRLLVPSPSYPLFDQLARLDAVSLVPYVLDVDDGWRPDLDALAAAPEGCRALVVVHPNNPTGSFIQPEDAERLGKLCRARGWALIADEVFLPYPLDGGPGSDHSFAATSSCLSFSLGGLSKSVGLPQLKLGWIAVSGPAGELPAALARLEYVADAYLSVSTPVALAAPRLLERGLLVQRAIADRCRANLDQLRELAGTTPAVTVLPAGGGWSAVLRVPALLDDEGLAVHLLETASVAVHPGYLFDLPGEGYLVVSLLPPEELFGEGVRRVLAAVDRLVAG
jgi:aspartate/methionine/tyrosine aminotransferase